MRREVRKGATSELRRVPRNRTLPTHSTTTATVLRRLALLACPVLHPVRRMAHADPGSLRPAAVASLTSAVRLAPPPIDVGDADGLPAPCDAAGEVSPRGGQARGERVRASDCSCAARAPAAGRRELAARPPAARGAGLGGPGARSGGVCRESIDSDGHFAAVSPPNLTTCPRAPQLGRGTFGVVGLYSWRPGASVGARAGLSPAPGRVRLASSPRATRQTAASAPATWR